MENHAISYNTRMYSTRMGPLHVGCEYLIAPALNFLIQRG